MGRFGYSGIVAGTAALAGCLVQPALAQQTYLDQPMQPGAAAAQRNCDGFSEMAGAGDGMTKEGAPGNWRSPQDRMRSTPSYVNGVAYCTRALELLGAQYPQYWLRKISLLQSRALHRALNRDFPGALADLDEATGAGAASQDVHYLRSLDFNTNMIRAYVLIESGDRTAGEALAMQTWARRSFSRAAAAAALTTIGTDGSRENIDTLLVASARLNPSRSGSFFLYLFERGRFAEALARFPELKAPVSVEDQAVDKEMSLIQRERQRAVAEIFWQDAMGRKAYALAALGRAAEARETLAQARARLDAATPEPNAPPQRASQADRAFRDAQIRTNDEIRSDAPPIRDVWARLTATRILAGEGRQTEVREFLTGTERLPATYATIDIVKALGPDASTDVDRLERTLTTDRLGLPRRHLTELFKLLLDGETLDRAHASRIGCEEGDSDERQATRWVCFEGMDATLAVAEERALLRAANQALERGSSHFVIEAREDFQHMVGNQGAGYESRLEVRFFQAPSQGCWRCLDAAQVVARLTPVYTAVRQRRSGR